MKLLSDIRDFCDDIFTFRLSSDAPGQQHQGIK